VPRPKATDSNARDLGGALVRFGPGGDVLSIKPAAASVARLQMCNVSCTWYQPSKTATVELTSLERMNEAAGRLRKHKILNRTLECKTVVNTETRLWLCYVKVGNLDISTTSKMLKAACGQKSCTITFGGSSYSSSAEEIGQATRRLLSSVGTIEAWTAPTSAKGTQMKATATFSSVEQATKAVTELNCYKLPQLGGSKILLSHMVKAKFSILSSMHAAISPEIADLQQSLSSKDYLEIKSYPPADKAKQFTILHIISNTAQDVGKAKAAVEKILGGHTARGAKDIIWNDFFLKPEGMAYLNDLGKQHNVFVYRNVRKCILSLYGSKENKAFVESALLKAVEDLAVSTYSIRLEGSVLGAALQGGFRRILERLGKTGARLNVTSNPKTITIHGSSQDADWARAILQEAPGQASDNKTVVGDNPTCAVCWCDVTETYVTPCGHVYDRECFINQCLSAGDEHIPIKCLGSSGDCQAVIPFPELEAALTRDQLDKLLEESFTRHVRTHPSDYQYCPTANCDQVYELTCDGKIFTCSTCVTSICTKCGAVTHEGLTCDQYKSAILGDDAFAEWKRKNDARDCPKCGCTIQKSEGCNHMECKACKAHICWVCMNVLDTGKETYEHMSAEHGGFYDPGYGNL
ncbi:hypothetical protein MMC30_009426, partial [Trapelia coarctata]|nr:hypothetical protein [Trapelia coarctata]